MTSPGVWKIQPRPGCRGERRVLVWRRKKQEVLAHG
jgi:hypothetical protein